jgi:predicted transcriptional regulator
MSLNINLDDFNLTIESSTDQELRLAQEEYDELAKVQKSLKEEMNGMVARIRGLDSAEAKAIIIKEEFEPLKMRAVKANEDGKRVEERLRRAKENKVSHPLSSLNSLEFAKIRNRLSRKHWSPRRARPRRRYG